MNIILDLDMIDEEVIHVHHHLIIQIEGIIIHEEIEIDQEKEDVEDIVIVVIVIILDQDHVIDQGEEIDPLRYHPQHRVQRRINLM